MSHNVYVSPRLWRGSEDREGVRVRACSAGRESFLSHSHRPTGTSISYLDLGSWGFGPWRMVPPVIEGYEPFGAVPPFCAREVRGGCAVGPLGRNKKAIIDVDVEDEASVDFFFPLPEVTAGHISLFLWSVCVVLGSLYALHGGSCPKLRGYRPPALWGSCFFHGPVEQLPNWCASTSYHLE